MEDGSIYVGKGFGKEGTTVGELVFNTSMTGYQEIVSDPSYTGQIVVLTYPLIGNYGANETFFQGSKIWAKGLIVKSISKIASNYLSEEKIEKTLSRMSTVGVYGVDTRSITKKVREKGTMKCVISTEDITIEKLKEIISATEIVDDYVKQVSCKTIKRIENTGYKVALIDFGIKKDIIKSLEKRNCDITIFPYNVTAEEIMSIKPDGVLLSNGPGNPKTVKEAIVTVKKLIGKVPIFGICLGHQILALALGGDTYKMKYGHRGGNHGVYDIEKDRAYITAQNHGYAVDGGSIRNKPIIVTHRNLNDNTIEGIRHKKLPVFSVQFHPEGAPGPIDTAYLFDKFILNMKNKRYKTYKDFAINRINSEFIY